MDEMSERHQRMIEDIHDALVGSEYNPNGLIRRIDKVEKKVNAHEVIVGIVAGLGTISGFVIGFWEDIKNIFQ